MKLAGAVSLTIVVACAACGGGGAAPSAVAPKTTQPVTKSGGKAATPLPVKRENPDKGDRPPPKGLSELEGELRRAMQTLGKANPPVHHLAYTVTDHEDVALSAEYGVLDTDVRREERSLDVD